MRLETAFETVKIWAEDDRGFEVRFFISPEKDVKIEKKEYLKTEEDALCEIALKTVKNTI